MVALFAVPPAVVMNIGPLFAPFGTVAVIIVGETTVNLAFEVLNFTAVAPVKFAPVIVTDVPPGPVAGEN